MVARMVMGWKWILRMNLEKQIAIKEDDMEEYVWSDWWKSSQRYQMLRSVHFVWYARLDCNSRCLACKQLSTVSITAL